jgi:hypothetical protein
MLVTHEDLRAKQTDIFSSVADNVKQLQQEKALIAAGNQQLAELAERIRVELSKVFCIIFFFFKYFSASVVVSTETIADIRLSRCPIHSFWFKK